MNVGARAPDIHYAKSGGLNIAFSVTGEGPDLVVGLAYTFSSRSPDPPIWQY